MFEMKNDIRNSPSNATFHIHGCKDTKNAAQNSQGIDVSLTANILISKEQCIEIIT